MFSEKKQDGCPSILVIAGPNGSGKRTVTKGLPVIGLYVNADEIKKALKCSDLEAAQEAEMIRRALLEARQDFTEAFLRTLDKGIGLLDKLMEEAKKAGYQICAVFVLTKDSAINVRRVRNRVKMGGHDVPEDKIISRYEKSLQNLSKLVRIADLTRIVDNSTDVPSVICEVSDGKARIWESEVWSTAEILKILA